VLSAAAIAALAATMTSTAARLGAILSVICTR
jgi:hypothetical protein